MSCLRSETVAGRAFFILFFFQQGTILRRWASLPPHKERQLRLHCTIVAAQNKTMAGDGDGVMMTPNDPCGACSVFVYSLHIPLREP